MKEHLVEMNGKRVRPAIAVGALALVALAFGACGSSEDAPAGAKKLSFELTDEGCLPRQATAPAGPIAIEVENTGSSKVTEIEIIEGGSILGEKENLSEGLSGSFSLTLGAGRYTVYCPGGSDERGKLTVTGAKHVEGATDGETDGDD